ncbi:metal ABC transporter solute-binding protein, Zn/Mn family [Terribacillus saccharophilus]|uniref:Manganese transporter n=1 Tax=Terribacillus saccharophilus TaxID=361277 RepID=A0ABX4GWJ6_9BACI|nr:zinc ABC transporter substrate-binding protein [Terribacillus saccharophilus]PAD34960.1 manganese transporter [Terribacillus saccharophilus]PAD95671.1 manganese transporter [Terribacillus saccharophilus]PAD99241.1 manganese transporter [Terribacillus saccharophilus]
MKKLFYFVSPLFAVFLLAGCGASDSASGSEENKLQVTTTIAQIADAAEQIGGEHVEVESLMGPGIDPHLYKATQSDMQKLQDADVILYNGLHLEGQMLEVFENMQDKTPAVAIGENIDGSGLLTDAEDNTLSDPHIWFDVAIWKDAIGSITDTFIEEDPDNKADYEKNETAYLKELDELKAYAEEQLASIPEEQRVLITAHDAFQYFGEAYDMEVMGLQGLSTDSEFGLADIQRLVDTLTERKIGAVFVESSVSEKSINAVIDGAKEAGHEVEIGGELYSDAMGEEGTEEGTYIGMYRHNVDTIVDALK